MNGSSKIFNWNVRGINSTERWDDIRLKIDESSCCVMTFQETKRESFDLAYIRNFCPKRFNQYVYMPSVGNSGGLITIWNSNLFSGRVISRDYYQITVELTSKLDNSLCYITNIHGPNSNEGKTEFTNWLMDVNVSSMEY